MERLFALFRNKCAFCESAVGGVSPAEVVHLRPVSNTLDVGGSVAPDHYWWLAYDWRNLYLSCTTCARVRGTRFPVRATRGQPRLGVAGARSRGSAAARPLPRPPRGSPALPPRRHGHQRPRARARHVRHVRPQPHAARRGPPRHARAPAGRARRGRRGHRAAARPAHASSPACAGSASWSWAAPRRGDATAEVRVVTPKVKRDVGADFARRQEARDSYALEVPSQQEGYFSHARHVERIELRNFRVIDELDLSLQLDTPSARPQGSRSVADAAGRERPRQEHGAPGRRPRAARRTREGEPRPGRLELRPPRHAPRHGARAPDGILGADRARRAVGLRGISRGTRR